MRIIKLFLGVIIGLVLLVLLGALFLPAHYEVRREITINAPAQNVYNQISDLKNWRNFSPWTTMDKKANYTYEGIMGQKGSKMLWNGDSVGTGILAIDTLLPHSIVTTLWVFKEPFESESKGFWYLTPTDSGTKVVWGNRGELDYPVGVIFGLAMDGMLGPDFEKGLLKLKKHIEKGQKHE